MKNTTLIKILKSNYCKAVFILSLVIVSFLTPKKIFYMYYSIIGVLFIVTTSLLITCLVRNIKDKASSAKANGASILGIIATILGFGALQTCTIGAPFCGVSIGTGLLALMFPNIAFNLLEENSITIIIISLVVQIITLYFIDCFKNRVKIKAKFEEVI